MKEYSVVPFIYIMCRLVQQVDTNLPNNIPRKTIEFTNGDIKTFMKKGFANYSTLLISEEMNTLFVGARGAVFALNMDNVSDEKYSEYWEVTKEKQLECTRRGKIKDVECLNYILLLQKLNTTTLFVCGTNAFNPSCDYMFLRNNRMHLERNAKESRGKCPFEPTLRFTSLLIDEELYSATLNNFLGSEPIIYRSLKNHLRTEFKSSWLNEPSFVHMDLVQESENSQDGDDDKIYIFFSETAIEFEFYDKPLVSRIARVCKGDRGGKRILQRKWTSFLKASLVCSVPESNFHFNIVQDVFLLKTANWRETIFYGVFTPQWGKLDISAVCAFSIQSVRDVFSQGKYKELVTVERVYFKWVMHSGEVPVPRPGACINNYARSSGYSTSLDLPDKTLQFVKDHPLMDDAVYPIGNKPVLLKRGANYTKIVVDRVKDKNQEAYDVMFIGTDNGFLHKALNCDGEMLIVEETQLFESPEPVQSLKLSSKKGLLYAGSPSHVVQIPLYLCDRHTNCLECVLARDPYCAWSSTVHKCVTLADHIGDSQALLQSVESGDASECPKVENPVLNCSVVPGSSIQLECVPSSNLASTKWMFNGNSLPAKDSKYLFYERGLVIFNITTADGGFYDCQSVEKANGKEFFVIVARFDIQPQEESLLRILIPNIMNNSHHNTPVEDMTREVAKQVNLEVGIDLTLKILVGVFSFLFFSLLIWNIYKGHIPPPCSLKKIKHPTSINDTRLELKDHTNTDVISQKRNTNNPNANNSNNLQQNTNLEELSFCSSNTYNCTDLQQSENMSDRL